ncbi:MAG TPA: TIGR03545 family protein [Bacteroidota bacterium]|nr:TIGR03545 family protein [Bacteroidota bacterium]
MRTKFVYFVVVPVFILLAVLYLFLDTWVEAGLEYAGESIVGAKVEIDDLSLTLSPIGAEFARLQVANPRDTWKNTFETARVKFALNFGQLLRGKYIIETMEVNDLILGTMRTTDGAIPKEPEPESEHAAGEPSLSQQADSMAKEKKDDAPVFDLDKLRKQLNIDSLLNVQNLASVRHIDSLKTQISQASQQWQATLTDIEKTKTTVADIETKIKAINVNELRSVESITTALNNVTDAQRGIKEISQTFNSRKSSLTGDVNRLSASVGAIDDLVKQDFQNVLELARLPDVSMKGLAELLLGKDILTEANEYLYWIDFARDNIRNSSSKPENAHPPRMRGQTIHFPAEKSYPKFWIKKILVSGGTDREQDPNYFYATGEIKDVSSDQRITGLPLTVDLSATQGRGTNATVKATIDRTKDAPLDTYLASLSGVPIREMSLGRSDFLPAKMSNAVGRFGVEVKVPANQFDGNARITLSNLSISFDRAAGNTVERLVRSVLESIHSLNVMLRFWKETGALKVAFETDLDNLLADRTKKVIGEEVARLRNELRQKLERKIAEKRQEMERLFSQKREEVTARIKSYENMVNDKLAIVDAKKKELEDRVNAEKKKQEDALKKKAGDALKGILKKKN